MDVRQLLTGNPKRSSLLYLGIGGISLLKALAVRNDRTRFRRELLDAALFLGVGLALRKYGTLRDEKREELRSSIPDWVLEQLEGGDRTDDGGGIGAFATSRLGRPSASASEPESTTLRARAKGIVAD